MRLCKECKATLFDRRDFEDDVTRNPPEVRSYGNLIQFERGIRLHMPKFQKLLSALQYAYKSILANVYANNELEIQDARLHQLK